MAAPELAAQKLKLSEALVQHHICSPTMLTEAYLQTLKAHKTLEKWVNAIQESDAATAAELLAAQAEC